MEAKRVVIYARTSLQEAKQDIEVQLLPCRKRCSDEGWDNVTEIHDTGSGAKNDRPGWVRLQAMIKDRAVDVIVLYDLSRATRSLAELCRVLDLVQEHDVMLLALNGPLPMSTRDPVFRLTASVLIAVAEFERRLLILRTKDGLRKARAAGKRLGGIPISKEREDLIMSLRAAGKSINAISYETKHGTGAISRVFRERGDPLSRLGSRGGKAGKKDPAP